MDHVCDFLQSRQHLNPPHLLTRLSVPPSAYNSTHTQADMDTAQEVWGWGRGRKHRCWKEAYQDEESLVGELLVFGDGGEDGQHQTAEDQQETGRNMRKRNQLSLIHSLMTGWSSQETSTPHPKHSNRPNRSYQREKAPVGSWKLESGQTETMPQDRTNSGEKCCPISDKSDCPTSVWDLQNKIQHQWYPSSKELSG